MSRFIIAPSASQDLDRIADYFLERNIEVGETLFREFNQKCFNLVKFPNIGRSYSQIRPNLRGLPLDGYIILYEVVDEDVEILRVVNGRQDLTLSGLKTLRFLRNFVLNIPIARVPGRNPFAKKWWAAILAFQQAPQAFKGF